MVSSNDRQDNHPVHLHVWNLWKPSQPDRSDEERTPEEPWLHGKERQRRLGGTGFVRLFLLLLLPTHYLIAEKARPSEVGFDWNRWGRWLKLLIEIVDWNCWLKSLIEIVDWNHWLKSFIEIIDCWLKFDWLLIEIVDWNCWLKSLIEIVDWNCWLKRLTNQRSHMKALKSLIEIVDWNVLTNQRVTQHLQNRMSAIYSPTCNCIIFYKRINNMSNIIFPTSPPHPSFHMYVSLRVRVSFCTCEPLKGITCSSKS